MTDFQRSFQPAPHSATFRSRLHALLSLHGILPRTLTALLPLTPFSARSAQISALLTIRSHALVNTCGLSPPEHISGALAAKYPVTAQALIPIRLFL